MGKVFYGPKGKGDYIEDAIRLWNCYGSSYRKFKKMIDGQRNGKKQAFRIPNEVMEEFPVIPLLQTKTEAEAHDYLKSLTEDSIKLIIRMIDRLEYNYGYRYMRERGVSYRLIDSRHPRCPFRSSGLMQIGVDPEHVMSGTARKKTHFDQDTD